MEIINWLNQNQGLVLGMLTFVYVIATIVIAGLTFRTTNLSKKNIETAIELEKNRLRPYIVFNISSSTQTRVTFASLKNVGLTAAYNTSVYIEPKLIHAFDGDERECVLTSTLIPFLPPGEDDTDVLGNSPAFHSKNPGGVFEGFVAYETLSGDKFKEPFKLELTYLRGRMYIVEPRAD